MGPLCCWRSPFPALSLARTATSQLQWLTAASVRRLSHTGARVHTDPLQLQVVHEGQGLRVCVGDQCRVFPARWVRDHCMGEDSVHPHTLQRMVDSVHIPKELRVRQVSTVSRGSGHKDDGTAAQEDALVVVQWGREDVPDSVLGVEFLRQRVLATQSQACGWERSVVPQVLWNGTTVRVQPPVVQASRLHLDLVQERRKLLSGLLSHGFVCVDGVEPTLEATKWLAELVGPVRNTIYGGMWEFQADLAAADTAYTNIALGAHSDGTYFSHAPGLQMLHCVHYNASGGDSLLVDGFHCVEQLRRTRPDCFQFLTEHSIPAHYMDPQRGILLSSCQPIIRLQADGSVQQLRYNNNDRAPLDLESPEKVEQFYDSIRALGEIIEDPQNEFWFPLRPGRVLIFDNWRLLHGRGSYQGDRRMTGCYIDRDDFLSSCRVAGLLK